MQLKTLAVPGTAASQPDVRRVRIALAGCGTVGSALVRLLEDRRSEIRRVHALHFDIVRVLVRDARRARDGVQSGLVTADAAAFAATDCDVVVEAMGGTGDAATVARAALGRGTGFITANKALLARHGVELAALARRTGAALAFEAAAAGAIPVVRVLREAVPHAGVHGIRGILNGTTNYVLTRMHEGASFDDALAEARARGFAEADATRDLDGRDAADKVRILAWQAFGMEPQRLDVDCTGLLPQPGRLVADAVARGCVARLVAEAARVPGGVFAVVEPVFVPAGSAAGRTTGPENLVEVDTAAAGTLRLSGPGAGGDATASAILGDLVATAATPPPAASCASVPDPRAHRWSVSVPARFAPRLDAALAELRIPALASVADAAAARTIAGPAPRCLAAALRRRLELDGCSPLVVRLDAP